MLHFLSKLRVDFKKYHFLIPLPIWFFFLGAGFTIAFRFDATLNRNVDGVSSHLAIDGMTTVSGSLDEEEADDITKGFAVTVQPGVSISLTVTDGFDTTFQHCVALSGPLQRDHYQLGADTLVAFVLDGGPKVGDWLQFISNCAEMPLSEVPSTVQSVGHLDSSWDTLKLEFLLDYSFDLAEILYL